MVHTITCPMPMGARARGRERENGKRRQRDRCKKTNGDLDRNRKEIGDRWSAVPWRTNSYQHLWDCYSAGLEQREPNNLVSFQYSRPSVPTTCPCLVESLPNSSMPSESPGVLDLPSPVVLFHLVLYGVFSPDVSTTPPTMIHTTRYYYLVRFWFFLYNRSLFLPLSFSPSSCPSHSVWEKQIMNFLDDTEQLLLYIGTYC